MAKSEILKLVVIAFLHWLLTDNNKDGVPDVLEPFLRTSGVEKTPSDE